MLRFGQFWLVYQLTGSPLPLGYVGLANGIPAICPNLFGGVFADKCDQRRLVIVTQSLTASCIFVLATLTLLNVVQVWHILVIAFCAGAVDSFDQPARQSLYLHLIDRKVMSSAVALNSSLWQGTRIIMPVGGMLASVLAGLITAPFAIAVGGLAVAAFAIGPAMMNGEVRSLGTLLGQVDTATASGTLRPRPSPSADS
jgi:MFS family permease